MVEKVLPYEVELSLEVDELVDMVKVMVLY